MRAEKTGWDKVRSRKFASDITVPNAFESVEYVWFINHRAIVILTRVSLSPSKPKVRISEVLFYAPAQRTDILPKRPDLVVLMHDTQHCVSCSNDICTCPASIGISRGSLDDLAPKSSPSHNNSAMYTSPSPPINMSWEHRMRMVVHGKKRGVLTILYTTPVANFPHITVRQAYHSSCANQDEIAYRIQQQLTNCPSKLPPPTQLPRAKHAPTDASSFPPSLLPSTSDNFAMTFAHSLSGQSPLSLTSSPPMRPHHPGDTAWLEPSKQKPPPPAPPLQSTPTQASCNDTKKPSCCSKLVTAFDPKNRSSPIQPSPEQEQPAVDLSPAASAPSISSRSLNLFQSVPLQSSVCGPEKADAECQCSAEDMPDSSLALILNSNKDRAANSVPDISGFVDPIVDPIIPPTTNACSLFVQPTPISGRGPTPTLSREGGKVTLASTSSNFNFGNQSPEGKDGAGLVLQLQLPPPPVLSGEPPLKRSRSDGVARTDTMNLSLEAGRHIAFDERDKSGQLPSWGLATILERPPSALGRALGVARSPSPLALIGNMENTPSSSAPALSPNVSKSGKATSQDFGLQRHAVQDVSADQYDPMEPIAKPVDEPQLQKDEGALKRERAPNGTSSHLTEGGMASSSDISGGSGVCCEICGISFAKRSNKLRHIQTVHNRLKQFECDLCEAKFGLKADLGRHRYRIHESRAFCCVTCGKSFTARDQLDLHIRITHEEDSRPWECKKCRIRFGRKSSLTRHEQTVHQQTRFECKFCKKSYSQKFDAVRHERKVHGFNDKASE